MRYFPVFMDLKNKTIAVIGSGEQAAQKIRLLMKTTAHIRLISREPNDELKALINEGAISWETDKFNEDHISDCQLVYAASEPEINERVMLLANQLGIPVNVVDEPDMCSFITPAIVDRDPIVIAIGTEGAAPVMARKIKSKLETELPTRLGALAAMAGTLRNRVAKNLSEPKRRAFWESFFSGKLADLFYRGEKKKLKAEIDRILDDTIIEKKTTGHVTLVGAGPGPADLLTFRALRNLQAADVIVYDRLIDPSVLECCRRDAKRIYVGKEPNNHSVRQEEINDLLLEEARKGLHVVRLKSGDPLVFGRAGEELDFMRKHGITVDVVPGVTAATACAAEVGDTLTYRDKIRAITFLTGHSMRGATPYDWANIALPGTVIALYMAVKMAPKIQANLLAVGVSEATPVRIVEKGCSPEMRSFETTLANLSHDLQRHKVTNPAMIYIILERDTSIDEESSDSEQAEINKVES
jgi:uroporphyrin-III C-methyltransferase/precorrin-2 dehydrogenase/sirohydrochlorin ferrochelatase